MSDKIIVDGDCLLQNLIDGETDLNCMIEGIAEKIVRYREADYYTGEYTYTPSQEIQTIPIAQLTASDDITINPIPSNYGLITWNGSTLTVS